MNKNEILLNSRNNKFSSSKRLSYYNEIPRTSDLLKSAEFSINNSKDLLISKFFIAPSTMRLDDMVEEAIFELNRTISTMKLPKEGDLRDKSIQENFDSILNSKVRNEFEVFISTNGHTGVLSKVASSINNSTIDQLSRAMLSEEGILFYLAVRAIRDNKITDADGVGANILESLGIVKSHINIQLVDKVIKKENLSVTDKERRVLKNSISEKHISYFPGNAEQTIVKLVDDLKAGGKLYAMVTRFLNSGKVNLDRNTNKAELAQKMVDYLIKLGYNEDYEDDQYPSNDPPNNSTTENEDIQEADEFESIEGVGKVTKKELLEVGIKSFSHLASFDVEGLKLRLKNPKPLIKYDEIIEQAKLISKGKFKDLLKYQDELNKRK